MFQGEGEIAGNIAGLGVGDTSGGSDRVGYYLDDNFNLPPVHRALTSKSLGPNSVPWGEYLHQRNSEILSGGLNQPSALNQALMNLLQYGSIENLIPQGAFSVNFPQGRVSFLGNPGTGPTVFGVKTGLEASVNPGGGYLGVRGRW